MRTAGVLVLALVAVVLGVLTHHLVVRTQLDRYRAEWWEQEYSACVSELAMLHARIDADTLYPRTGTHWAWEEAREGQSE